ncbi:hypothetical protein EES42_34380 [Streptomyces sp. ADI95-17]|nr:hypothetical protein EES42_34380 [Streptomyces sp. ADI95-17]
MAGKVSPANMVSPAMQVRAHTRGLGRSSFFSAPGPPLSNPVCLLLRLITGTSTS